MHNGPVDGVAFPARPLACKQEADPSSARASATSSDAATACASVDGDEAAKDGRQPAWYVKAAAKRQARDALIPVAWRLPQALLEALPLDVRPIPASCGLLTAGELALTEEDDAAALVARMASGELRAVDVCRAYCKRAAIAQQLVRCRPR